MVVQRLTEWRIVAVVRGDSWEEAVQIGRALARGGIRALEVTMTVPQATQALEALSQELGESVLLGAGSLTTREQAQDSLLAGAHFLVSPAVVPEVIEVGQQRGTATMPGALTPSEILTAVRAGADMVKVFPVSAVGGPSYIKALLEPLPWLKLVPTGGMTLGNLGEFLAHGAACVGLGGALIPRALVKAEDWVGLTAHARKLAQAVRHVPP